MTDSDDAIVLHRTIAATPERLFRAFTRPEELARWMSPVGHAEVEVDLRIGGALRVAMIGDGIRMEHTGQFLELDPPHRIAFTWQSDYTGGVATRVIVDLAETMDGSGTDLTLRHELLPASARASHAGGWGAMLDRLAAATASAQEEVSHGA
jgi:uncharacterized protein YndB with AHSA1/START domain